MNKKLVILFKKRWENVQNIESAELIKMPLEEKLLKTESIIKLGFGMGIKQNKFYNDELKNIRSRWVKAKRLSK